MNNHRHLLSVLVGLAACTTASQDSSLDAELELSESIDEVTLVELEDEGEEHERPEHPVERFESPDGRGEAVMVDDRGEARSMGLAPARVVPWSPTDLTASVARHGAAPESPRLAVSPTETAVAHAASLEPTERLSLLVSVDAPPTDFHRFQGRTGEARREAIAERRAGLEPVQLRVGSRIEALGGTVLGRRWISSHVLVEIDAGRVEELSRLPEVTEIELDAEGVTLATYDGRDIRNNTLANELLAASRDSFTGARANGLRVRVGVIELNNGSNWINRNHVAWRTVNWSTLSRIAENYDCDGSGCSTTTMNAPNGSHGTLVASLASGDLTDGQDSSITNTIQREQRSGIATESSIYYYAGSNFCQGLEAAVEQAVLDEVDVINMSFGLRAVSSTFCDPDYSCMNEALANAADAGVLLVSAAGNEGHGAGCNVNYPANHPDVVSVAALDTDTTVDYDDASLRTDSSRGGIAIEIHDGPQRTAAAVDLAAPGCAVRFPQSGVNGYATSSECGTSVASPIVAAIAANMRDHFDAMEWNGPVQDAHALMVNLLLLGDKWDYDQSADRNTGVSDTSGFGRIKAHFPSNDSLTAPWGWGWRSEHLVEGQTKSWTVGDAVAESPAVQQYKWAVTWSEDDFNGVSDVVARLYDTCPPGGGEVLVSADMSYDPRKSVRLEGSEIGGRCLEMRVTAFSTPPGGVTVYSADYWHGGDPQAH
ncbi:MAG: S8 family serine peptidase [Myxococcota bacterium]